MGISMFFLPLKKTTVFVKKAIKTKTTNRLRSRPSSTNNMFAAAIPCETMANAASLCRSDVSKFGFRVILTSR